MAKLEHIFFDGHDNAQAVYLESDGAKVGQEVYDAITRIVLTLKSSEGETVVDSNIAPNAFNYVSAPKIIIDIGSQGIDPGEYEARLVVYLSTEPNGIVWADYKDYTIKIKA